MGSHHPGDEAEVRALSAFINLIRAAETVLDQVGPSRGGLTLSQFGVLEALFHLGPLHQCELGAKLLKSSGNITMVVDNLEKRGLVRREREGDDRRFIRVNLTPPGRALIEAIFPAHAADIARQFSRLSPEEQDTLRALCRKLGRPDSQDSAVTAPPAEEQQHGSCE